MEYQAPHLRSVGFLWALSTISTETFLYQKDWRVTFKDRGKKCHRDRDGDRDMGRRRDKGECGDRAEVRQGGASSALMPLAPSVIMADFCHFEADA